MKSRADAFQLRIASASTCASLHVGWRPRTYLRDSLTYTPGTHPGDHVAMISHGTQTSQSTTMNASVSLSGKSVSMSFATLMRCAFMSPRCGMPPLIIFSVPFGSVSTCGKSEKCVGQ